MAESEQPPESAPDAPPPPASDDSLSLSDFEAKFHGERREASTEPATPPAETAEAEPAASQTDPQGETERDEKGRFLPKKTPAQRRPASHEASPEAVPRINELTRKWRQAEAERDALRAQLAAHSAPAPAPASPAPAADDPEPQASAYDDYSKFVAELARWHARQEHRQWQAQQAERERQQTSERERQRLEKSWLERVDAAKQRYPDFQAVAIEADTPIRSGSLIDAWILDPDNETGPDLLYYLQLHPDEVARIDKLPVLKQAESLSLLSQRFVSSNGRGRAADTGSAPVANSTPPPKPPNPVRTGPVRAGDEPPDPEKSSLADHEKWYAARSRRGGGSARA